MKLKLPDGNTIQLSHLDNVNVKTGDRIGQFQQVGTVGNTGNVIPGPNGDGSHIDIRVTRPDGYTIGAYEVEDYLKNYNDKTTY